MLAQVLPGFREVRTTVACGALWAGFFWLALQPSFPERDEATGVIDDLYRFGDLVSVAGVVIALGLAAFLIGAAVERPSLRLVEYLASLIYRTGGSIESWVDPWPLRDDDRPWIRRAWERSVAAFSEALRSFAGNRVATLSSRGALLVDDLVSEVLKQAQPHVSGIPPGDIWDEIMEAPFWSTRDPGMVLGSLAQDDLADAHRSLTRNVVEELDSMRLTLLRQAPSVYAESDRLRAEGQIRIVVVPALVALTVLAAVQINDLALLGLIPVALIASEGLHRLQASGDIVLTELAAGNVTSRWLEELPAQAARLSKQHHDQQQRAALRAHMAASYEDEAEQK